MASSRFFVFSFRLLAVLSQFLTRPLLHFSKMMFSFKSLAVAAGIAFAAISSVVATHTPCPTCDVTTTTTYVQEKSLVYVLEKTKYEITPVVHKFRKYFPSFTT